jgi:anti-anti-sigma factor
MNITYASTENRQTFFLQGKLDHETYAAFDSFFRDKYQKSLDVLLDLTQLNFVSSVGLRSFIALAKIVHTDKNRLAVKALPDSMPRQIISLSGFSKFMPFED